MSIMRASYRDDGGTATPATTIGPVINSDAGLTPQQLHDKYPPPVQNDPEHAGETADDYNLRYQEWKQNNRWWIDAYGEPNITPRTEAEIEADRLDLEYGGRKNEMYDESAAAHKARTDPESEYNKTLARESADATSGSYFGAGTPGSTRGQYYGAQGAAKAVIDSTAAAQDKYDAAIGRMGSGNEMIRGVGEGQHAYADTVQEAKTRMNDYYRGLGKQQGAADLGYLKTGEVTPPASSSKGSNGWSALVNNPLLQKLFGFAEGGSVPYYRDFGGAVGGGAAAMPQQGGGIVGAGMDLQNPVPQGMNIPNATSNPGMPDQGMGLGATETPQGMGLGATPTSTQGMGGMAPQGIAGAGMEPMPEPSMSMIEIDEKPKSELDMLEEQMIDAVAASGGDITITRKTTKRRSRK